MYLLEVTEFFDKMPVFMETATLHKIASDEIQL